MRRVRKAVGGNDKSASGATPVAGTENFKRKYVPDFPVVTILEAVPGRVVTTSQLEALGLVAPPEPVIVSSVISLPTFHRQRFGGERRGRIISAALKRLRCPRSMADQTGTQRTLTSANEPRDTVGALRRLQRSCSRSAPRLRSARLLDEGYALITAQNAAAAAQRGRKRGRGN
jgi:hypothetical protein